MATAEQLKALLQSHFNNEDERFITLALQIAAHEAKLGHVNIANDVRKLIEKAKVNLPKFKPLNKDLEGAVIESHPSMRFKDLVISSQQKERVQRVLNEYHQRGKLRSHGLENRRKILLAGPPGTGKTMTASIIARELDLPLYTVMMDKMVTRFMGETSAKLRQIFELINDKKGIYLFDEFDAIGGERGKENDVGEMRRVLNSFLQFLERDNSDSIIVAATNIHNLLDQALFRRFDDVLHYELPNLEEIGLLVDNRLSNYKGKFDTIRISTLALGLSHAEISRACLDAIKNTIMADGSKVEEELLVNTINERKHAYLKLLKL